MIINVVTRIKFSLIVKNKNDICSVFISVFNKMRNQVDRKCKCFRMNDEKEFKNLTFELNDRDIQWEKLILYAQNQDNIFERSVRTIVKRSRIFIIHAHLSRNFWFEKLIVVCYIINCLLIKLLDEIISYKVWYEKKSDSSNLKIYDCDVYVVDY